MRRFDKRALSKSLLLAVALIVTLAPIGAPVRVSADQLIPRSLTMSNNYAGSVGVSYRMQFTFATTGPVGSIALLFCDNTALLDQPCNAPAGFDATSVLIGAELGATGFALYSGSTANQIILTRPPTSVNSGTVSVYDFSRITNPSNPGPLYARIYTYPTSDASGPYTDAGGLALYYLNSLAVNAEVPPFLLFCLGENISGLDCSTATEAFSDLGTLSPNLTSAAQHQLLVATNAANGYSMWVQGNPLTSGNNVLTAMSGGTVQQGTSQFGINLRANSTPSVGQDPSGPGSGTATSGYNQTNHFKFVSGDTLATATQPDDFRKYTVSYVVDIPNSQPGGVYSTTLTYVCLANF